MILNQEEKYVLATIGSGMVTAALNEGIISESTYNLYCQQIYYELGTTVDIIFKKLDVDPFMIIRQMDQEKKNFTKKFFVEVLQRVPTCDAARYYFASTLERGGLVTEI